MGKDTKKKIRTNEMTSFEHREALCEEVRRHRAMGAAQNGLPPIQLINHRDMIFLLCVFPHIPPVSLLGLLFPFKSWEVEEQRKVD